MLPKPELKEKQKIRITTHAKEGEEEMELSSCTADYNPTTLYGYIQRTVNAIKAAWPEWASPQEPSVRVSIYNVSYWA